LEGKINRRRLFAGGVVAGRKRLGLRLPAGGLGDKLPQAHGIGERFARRRVFLAEGGEEYFARAGAVEIVGDVDGAVGGLLSVGIGDFSRSSRSRPPFQVWPSSVETKAVRWERPVRRSSGPCLTSNKLPDCRRVMKKRELG
jgi:hypothetical protein